MNRVTDMQRFRNSRKCNTVNHIKPLLYLPSVAEEELRSTNVFVVAVVPPRQQLSEHQHCAQRRA